MDPFKPGQPISADGLNALAGGAEAFSAIRTGAGLHVSTAAGAPTLGLSRPRSFFARLMSLGGSFYGWREEYYDVATGGFKPLAGGRTGTPTSLPAVDLNLAADLPVGQNGGSIEEFHPAPSGNYYWFDHHRAGQPTCSTTLCVSVVNSDGSQPVGGISSTGSITIIDPKGNTLSPCTIGQLGWSDCCRTINLPGTYTINITVQPSQNFGCPAPAPCNYTTTVPISAEQLCNPIHVTVPVCCPDVFPVHVSDCRNPFAQDSSIGATVNAGALGSCTTDGTHACCLQPPTSPEPSSYSATVSKPNYVSQSTAISTTCAGGTTPTGPGGGTVGWWVVNLVPQPGFICNGCCNNPDPPLPTKLYITFTGPAAIFGQWNGVVIEVDYVGSTLGCSTGLFYQSAVLSQSIAKYGCYFFGCLEHEYEYASCQVLVSWCETNPCAGPGPTVPLAVSFTNNCPDCDSTASIGCASDTPLGGPGAGQKSAQYPSCWTLCGDGTKHGSSFYPGSVGTSVSGVDSCLPINISRGGLLTGANDCYSPITWGFTLTQ